MSKSNRNHFKTNENKLYDLRITNDIVSSVFLFKHIYNINYFSIKYCNGSKSIIKVKLIRINRDLK